jgi:hypothetical protein
VTTSNTGPFGSFRYSFLTETWWWSEGLFQIHGFAPGEVVPSTDLLLVHKHPDDRDVVQAALRAVLDTGEPFAVWHRVVDAQGTVHQVVSVGEGVRDPSGRLTGVRGHMVDLTGALRRSSAAEVEEAVEALSESRPVIEQVKGGLMATFGLDPDSAFEVLRRYSQATNVKVRDLARRMVEAMTGGQFPVGERQMWDDLVAEVLARSTNNGAAEQSVTARDGDRDPRG